MALTGAISITRKRKSSTDSWTDGFLDAKSFASTTITGTVASVPGNILEMLELGEREYDARYILSTYEILNQDELVIGGVTYKVIKTFNDSTHGFLSHYEAVIVQEKE